MTSIGHPDHINVCLPCLHKSTRLIGWSTWCTGRHGFTLTCICLSHEHCTQGGPYDGIIGFSQGANMASMMAAVTEFSAPRLIKFVVCICGVESGWAEQLPDLFPPKASSQFLLLRHTTTQHAPMQPASSFSRLHMPPPPTHNLALRL